MLKNQSYHHIASAFLALPLEGEAKAQFHQIHERLLSYDGKELSLQSPETPHLTLYFWRVLMPIEVRDIETHTEKIAASSTPFSLTVNGHDAFSSHGKTSVLFLSIAFSEELAQLKKSFQWPNEMPFHPHITLARVRHAGRFAIKQKEILKAIGSPLFPVTVDKLRLYAKQGTVTQSPLRDFPFGCL